MMFSRVMFWISKRSCVFFLQFPSGLGCTQHIWTVLFCQFHGCVQLSDWQTEASIHWECCLQEISCAGSCSFWLQCHLIQIFGGWRQLGKRVSAQGLMTGGVLLLVCHIGNLRISRRRKIVFQGSGFQTLQPTVWTWELWKVRIWSSMIILYFLITCYLCIVRRTWWYPYEYIVPYP